MKMQSGVLNASIAATLNWVGDTYAKYTDKKLTVKLLSNPARLRDISFNRTIDGKEEPAKLHYPYALFAIADYSLNTEKPALRRDKRSRGIITGLDHESGFVSYENMRPVNVSMGLTMRTDSMDESKDFITMILLENPGTSFYITGANGFKVQCSIILEPNVTPQPAESGDSGMFIGVDTVLKLSTYIGTVTEERLIRKVNVGFIADPTDNETEYDLETNFLDMIRVH